jgi:hypothetical protein
MCGKQSWHLKHSSYQKCYYSSVFAAVVCIISKLLHNTTLLANIGVSRRKKIARKKYSSLFCGNINYVQKSFQTLTPRPSTINLICSSKKYYTIVRVQCLRASLIMDPSFVSSVSRLLN